MHTYTRMDAVLSKTLTTPRHTIHVWRHGVQRHPVLVIDNYFDKPDALIEMAATGPAFEVSGPYYPGIRAPFPQKSLSPLLDPLSDLLGPVFGYTNGAQVRECSFSLVTTTPEALMPIQRLPHFDSLETGRIAALLFLGKGNGNGGTAFYRQRSTGFEAIDRDCYGRFEAALNADVARFGLPEANYVGDDNPMYETLAVHEALFNRMLVYPSATLHSGRIPADFAFSTDPRLGRLTVNAFIGPKP
jgi:hypothetical protein